MALKNTYKLISEPESAFKEVFKTLREAKESIYVETYKVLEDRIGKELISILKEKSISGVKVTLMVDYWGVRNSLIKKLSAMSKELDNFEFITFNPLYFTVKKQKSIHKFFEKLHNRNHRKLIIVDDEVAFVGGINFHTIELSWADIIVKIQGPILNQLKLAAHEMKIISKKVNLFKRRKIFKRLNVNFRGKDIVLRQIPGRIKNQFKKNILNILSSAEKEIIIVTPYFTPDFLISRKLHKAVKRGVDVKIIIPNHCDSFFADVLNKSFAYLINQKDITVYLYKGMVHAKFIIVDKQVCTFGSSNFDYQTWLHNYELNIVSTNKRLIRSLASYADLLIEKSFVFTKKMWWNRSLKRKLAGFLVEPFKKYF